MAVTMHGKKPLYRRVNTRTHGVDHDVGGDYKWSVGAFYEGIHAGGAERFCVRS